MACNNEHTDYTRMRDRWLRCRDVFAGQDAVHDAAERYLPKLKDQEPHEYEAYKKRTTFYNATYRTISGLVGMVFRQAPKIDVAPAIVEFLKDVTMSGIPLQVLAQKVTTDALNVGRVGLLVDCPELRPGEGRQYATRLDEIQQNIRPTIQMYPAESIINWRVTRVNNAMVLSLVVLKEQRAAADQTDEFKEKCEDVYRVLDLHEGNYRVRIMRPKTGQGGTIQDETLEEFYPLMQGQPLDFIPFVFIGTDDLTPEVDDPPFIDLVNLNLSHYLNTADYEHGAHFTGLPTPVVCGAKLEPGEKLYIGSTKAWVFPNPEAHADYLEFTGAGLQALKELIEHKEQQMAIVGARMLEPMRRQVETAETAGTHRKGEESLLSQIAQTVSMGIERALKWFSAWAGADYECVFELNRDFFPAPMQPAQLTALVSAWQMGAISEQTLFDNLKQGQIISEEKTLEEEQAQIAESAARIAAINSLVNPPEEDTMKGGNQE